MTQPCFLFIISQMENMTLSRTYLESLTTADLISLADDYGIDIPEGLSRRFIIGELLEVIDEPPKASGQGDMNINNSVQITTTLPKTYNETQISAILRNPAWIFVYWDINDADTREMQHPRSFSTFILRVLYFANPEDEKPAEVYEIPVQNNDRERYIFLSQSFKVVRVDLIGTIRPSISMSLLVRKEKTRNRCVTSYPLKFMNMLLRMRISPCA